MAQIKNGQGKHTMLGPDNAGLPTRTGDSLATQLNDVEHGNWPEDGSSYLAGRGHNLNFFHIASETTVVFKAFLTDYEDTFASSWNGEEVYGRMDPIQTFQGTVRNISLGWDVVANGVGEAYANLMKAEALIKMLYPMYDTTPGHSATTIGASPLIKLKYGNLISSVSSTVKNFANSDASAAKAGLVGTIDGLSYSPDIESGFFDVNDGGAVLPQTIKFSCNFVVLHDHPLGFRKGTQNKEWDNYFLGSPAADVVGTETSKMVSTQQPSLISSRAGGRSPSPSDAVAMAAEQALLAGTAGRR